MRELTMTESLMIAFDVFARVDITATPCREDRPYRLVLRSKRKIHFFVLAGLDPAIHVTRHTPLPLSVDTRHKAGKTIGSELNHVNASEH
jgi:hypothetical protein